MFKKILIKSEEDLPKEEGEYYWHIKGVSKDDKLYQTLFRLKDAKDFTFYFDWYLIESPISVPTEEEVEAWAYKNTTTYSEKDTYIAGAKWAIDEILKRNK